MLSQKPSGKTFKVQYQIDVNKFHENFKEGPVINDALTSILANSFILNTKDRIVVDVFKANNWQVIEFNADPTEMNIAEYILDLINIVLDTKGISGDADFVKVNESIIYSE